MIPPYNGFGSEEDSLGNCLSLIPKPPQRDFVKFMAHDRRGLDSNELRFTARLVTDVAVDRDRRFIVSYFRTDDTMLIFEPPVRNSGSIRASTRSGRSSRPPPAHPSGCLRGANIREQ